MRIQYTLDVSVSSATKVIKNPRHRVLGCALGLRIAEVIGKNHLDGGLGREDPEEIH